MQGLQIKKVKNNEEGVEFAKNLLYEKCNKNTALFLSGGSTPKALYKELSIEKKLYVGAAAIVDERFGEKMHNNSNEKMITETGLISFFKKTNTRFFPVLEKKQR